MNEIEGVVRYKLEHDVDRLIRKFSNLIPQVVPSVDKGDGRDSAPTCVVLTIPIDPEIDGRVN